MPETPSSYREKYPGRFEPKPRVLFRKAGFLESSILMVPVAILVMLAITVALEVFDFGFMRDEITAYGLTCNAPSVEKPCSESDLVRMEPPVTYKVLIDQQVVILILPDLPPRRLKDCVVVSRTDWKCDSIDGRDFGFQGGQFWEESPNATPKARFVNRFQWLRKPRPTSHDWNK